MSLQKLPFMIYDQNTMNTIHYILSQMEALVSY